MVQLFQDGEGSSRGRSKGVNPLREVAGNVQEEGNLYARYKTESAIVPAFNSKQRRFSREMGEFLTCSGQPQDVDDVM